MNNIAKNWRLIPIYSRTGKIYYILKESSAQTHIDSADFYSLAAQGNKYNNNDIARCHSTSSNRHLIKDYLYNLSILT